MKVFLGDGRALRYWSTATPGPIVLVFHGTPDTRRIAMTGDQAAREAGVRLLSFNRPGYGSSTPTATTHTSVARDAAELMDIWGVGQAAVIGMSVGATYAAAFAATYPERTTALALVSAPDMQVTEAEGTVEEAMERLRPGFMEWRAKVDPDDEDDEALAARFLAELPEADADLLGRLGTGLVADAAWDALSKPDGYLRDAALLFREWDFDPSDVRAPTSIWVGELDDRAVAASSWWAERIPQATVERAPGTTHLATLLTQWPQILERLGTSSG
ncbi:alpha/beta hydrolase [Nocardioides islandensis]|uniref:Alpha/beta hydrolase n=1 Tax=Nocardioides islandensis TaxID=433663 RepID=A0A930V9L4_9ACTN|nr:alpha/beta hydrolase [Nocardioides islandensis]MBF4763434.1 alpha/beta hydrolase [Nocardioides islandensis]